MAEERAQAGEFYSSHEQRETAPKDRRCEICDVVLSIYNDTMRCALHKHANILVGKRKARKRS